VCVIPLTLKDCAFAARLHQAAFYKGWTEEDFQEFLKDPLVFGLKIQYPSPAPSGHPLPQGERGFFTLQRMGYLSQKWYRQYGKDPSPLVGEGAPKGRVRGNKKTKYLSFILWREVAGEAEILTLVVDPSFQRKGLGQLLLNDLFEQLKEKGISKLFLEVAEDNESAKSFYIKNGFQVIGKRPNYYERPGHTFVDGLNLLKNIER